MSLWRPNPRRDGNEKKVVTALREAGVAVYPVSGRGLPDLLCFLRGRAFLVEVKVTRNDLSIAQREFHLRARQEGWPVFVATGADDVLSIINEVDNHAPKKRHQPAARPRPAPPAE